MISYEDTWKLQIQVNDITNRNIKLLAEKIEKLENITKDIYHEIDDMYECPTGIDFGNKRF